MMKFILGKKQGMSQIFDNEGNIVPVTVIEVGPCFITQIKTSDKDNYYAIQIGYEKLKEKKVGKSKKKKPYRYLREFSVPQGPASTQPASPLASSNRGESQGGRGEQDLAEGGRYKVGDEIDVSIFKEGDIVKLSGISKGKGFQGVVKRHGFSGGPASHGHRHVLRTPGSIGSMFPQRVVKGKKMPGHAGAERVTITGLKIVKVDKENNLLAVKGAIPGANGGLIEIKSQ